MRFLPALIIVLAVQATCFAQTTWYVPDDFTTIQGAISDGSVRDGDTVIVRPGTYVENINFLGKAITVKSEQGLEVTIIDGGNPLYPDHGSTVRFCNSEGPDSVLDGFTITNGTGTLDPVYMNYYLGGGIFCSSSSPTITNNLIRENSTPSFIDGYGGGVYCNYSSADIANNTISGNLATTGGGGIGFYASALILTNNTITGNETSDKYGEGGGIHCNNSPATIMNNTISGNFTSSWGTGGGIYFRYGSPTFRNNDITGNSAGYGGGIYFENYDHTITDNNIEGNTAALHGGGVYLFYSQPIITNNTISRNSASEGGGIYCNTNSQPPTITNNTIHENSADGGGGIYCNKSHAIITNNIIHENSASEGGGIFCNNHYHNQSPTITNNTICGNATDFGGGIYCHYSSPNIRNTILWQNSAQQEGPELWIGNEYAPSTVTIAYSDVAGGQASCFVDTGCTLKWGIGMIDSDPQFADPAMGDYHLLFNSPCRNWGDNTVITDLHDFEGDPRIAYIAVDMGADEFYPHLYYTGETAPNSDMELKFIGIPGHVINALIMGVKIFDPPLPCNYGLWYMDNPMKIITGVGIIPTDGIFVMPGRIPPVPSGPYTAHLQAAIDYWLSNLCTVHVQ